MKKLFVIAILLSSMLSMAILPLVAADDTNLAPMFQGAIEDCEWGDAHLHNGNPYYGIYQMGEYDNTTLSPAGNPSIKYFPNTMPNVAEIDHQFIAVSPGDHIVYSVWIKSESVSTARNFGGRIGIDFYGDGYSLDGLPNSGSQFNYFSETPYNPDSEPTAVWESTVGEAVGYNLMFHRWGETDWVQMKVDFVVPDKQYTLCYYVGYPYIIPATQIDYVACWIDTRPSYEMGGASNPSIWFADAELYINPTDVFEPENITPAPTDVYNYASYTYSSDYYRLMPVAVIGIIFGLLVYVVLLVGKR